VIAALAGATCIVSIAILMASLYGAQNFLLFAFAAWGGTALCVYSVCVAHACDIVEPDQIISTVGTLLFSWATGVTIGPLIGAMAMDFLGPNGLFVYSAIVSLMLAIFVLVRIRMLRRNPVRGGFADVPSTSPAAASLTYPPESARTNESSPASSIRNGDAADQSATSATLKSSTPS
jgi:MFS family permease